MPLSLSKILLFAWLVQDGVTLFDGKPNANGHYAFGYGGQPHDDVSLPNPRFFDDLEKRIRREPGLRIALAESAMLRDAGEEKARDLGRYLGRRLAKRKNFVYVAPARPSGAMRALVEGIREYDRVHWLQGQPVKE
jgi:hypothetical protein